MATFTFTDQVIELEDVDTGFDGRVYGDSSITDRHPTKGFSSLGKRVVTTNWVVCQDLYDALHDGNGCQLEDITVRITFDLDIEHEPRTRDYPGYEGREVNITKVEFIDEGDTNDESNTETWDGDSDVSGAIEALFAPTFESFEPDPIPEADHPRI